MGPDFKAPASQFRQNIAFCLSCRIESDEK
jgi:hypothetical protein